MVIHAADETITDRRLCFSVTWLKGRHAFIYYWKYITYRRFGILSYVTYFRMPDNMSLKFHSHALIFTVRIPEMISFMNSSRSSVFEAAFLWKWPAILDIIETYVITTKKKPAPNSACHPIRYHNRNPDVTISNGANTRKSIPHPAFLRRFASFDTKFMACPVIRSFTARRFSVRICLRKGGNCC